MKRRRRLPGIWSSLVIISALLISLMAVYLVSSRYNVRKIEIRAQLETNLLNMADSLGVEYARLCEDALSDANEIFSARTRGDNPLPAVKALSMKHPIIRYPFLMNGAGSYLFPFSRTGTSSLLKVPERAAMDAKVGGLYKEGKKKEDRRELAGAIQIYQKALKRNRKPSLFPHLYAAVGRCYLKMSRLPQAERYFTKAMGALPDLKTKDPDLFLIAERQKALIAHLEGNAETALTRYLQLYENSVSLEPAPRTRRYEFFRNEAVDFIAGHSSKMRSASETPLPEPVERFMKTRVSRDSALQWLFFDINDVDDASDFSESNGSPQKELIRLSDLYSSDSEKDRFYRALKNATFWKGLRAEAGDSFHNAVYSGGKPFRVSVIRIDADRYFGFSSTDEWVRNRLVREMVQKYPGDPALRVHFASTSATGSHEPRRGHVLLSVPAARLGDSARLFAISRSPDYLGERIRREMVLTYFLITILILFLFGGVLLWLRFIRRERELIRSKSDFLNLAAHTLRTPITRLSLLAENLSSGWVRDASERDQFLEAIGKESRGLKEMVENLLNFARIEAGKKSYPKKKISLSTVVLSVISRMEPVLLNAGFTVEKEIAPSLPPQWLDAFSMETVVSGLLENSVKYSRKEKWVRIRLVREKEEAVLSVRDRGMGIPAREAGRVFERFYRTDSPEVKSIEGSGLGLFLARHAVEAHGGVIRAFSDPGGGTEFEIRLPIPGEPE